MLKLSTLKLVSMERHERIAAAIEASGKLKSTVAKECGVRPSSVSQWLDGSSKSLKPENLYALARATGFSARWIAIGEGPERPTHDSDDLESNVLGEPVQLKQGLIPVKGKAMLGDGGYFEEMDYPQGAGDGYLRIYSDDPDAYALRVVGSSMEPRIRSGEFVMVEPNQPHMAGDEVLVRTADGRAMIKVFMYHRDGEIRLLSVNDSHPPLTISEADVTVIHPVGAIVKPSRLVEL